MNKTSSCNDVNTALSYVSNESLLVDVSLMPLGVRTTHEPTMSADELWGEVEVSRADEDSEASEHCKAL